MTDYDDVSDEGTPLPGNPELREVIPAAPTDRTSMIDLEAVEAKRAARRAEVEAEANAEPGEDEVTPPPDEALQRDPDATGTLARRPKRGQTQASRRVRDESRMQDAPEESAYDQPVDDAPEDDAGDESALASRTNLTRATRTGYTRAGTQQLKRKPKKPISPLAAAAAVIIGVVGLIVLVFVAVRATGVLTITTVPLGAAVTLDGEPIGISPLQKRVRTGTHKIELAQEGFEPFQEVVDVPSAGLSFLQPLKALPPPPPPPPTPAEIATDLQAQAQRLYDAGDLDGAAAKIAQILELVPDHQPSASLRALVKAALDKRAAIAANNRQNAAQEARLQKARTQAAEGLRLYNAGKLTQARTVLYDSLKLDPKNPDPHRTLAKIFNREDDVGKVRYHLERFLALGGNDGDFKVREWLKAHPK